MTSTMNDAIRDFLASNGYDSLSGKADAIAMVLLIVLLVEQELARAYAPATPQVRPLKVAIAPLLLTFVLVLVARGFGLR